MNIIIPIVLLIILIVFRQWFSFSGTLSSGDWPYLYLENIQQFSWFPETRFLWLAPYYQSLPKIFVQYLSVPWEITERLAFFIPLIVLLVFSSYRLTKSWIGVLIYTTNTYILMVLGGGQLGVAYGYAIAPLVLESFINASKKVNIKQFIVPALLLSVQTTLDPRIAYITFAAVLLYFGMLVPKKEWFRIAQIIFIAIICVIFVNLYWIIPLVSGKVSQAFFDTAKTSVEGLKYYSFADFSHAFSLLHPNWPENIFGKSYFLQPEFLVIPLIVFSSLLFIEKSKTDERKKILYFCLLGLFGIFLAKGANPPFGFINSFLYEYIPGGSMFRDPTKFYLLIAISYSFLTPLTAGSVQEWLNSKTTTQNSKPQRKTQNLLLLIFIFYWMFLIYPALFGELSGTFKTRTVPKEYIALKEFIKKQPKNTGFLWVPQKQRFGYASIDHLSLEAKGYSPGKPTKQITYVIVPYDSEHEIFISDRRYSDKLRNELIKKLDKQRTLQKITSFSPIVVYRVK